MVYHKACDGWMCSDAVSAALQGEELDMAAMSSARKLIIALPQERSGYENAGSRPS